jgi:hypothetical protein
MEPNKITLVGWVDQTLNQSLTKQNIKYGFGATSTWFYNPKIMDNIGFNSHDIKTRKMNDRRIN